MSRYFMYVTSFGSVEQLMMQAPNFQTRKSGIVIQSNFNCRGGIRYNDLLKDCFSNIRNQAFKIRLRLLSAKFNGKIFINQMHERRFYNAVRKHDIKLGDRTSRYVAALFLLTADERLWILSEKTVYPTGFDFLTTNLKCINTKGYALYQMAKTLWAGREYIKISEIADRGFIDDYTFKAIINASLIARYGTKTLLIEK